MVFEALDPRTRPKDTKTVTVLFEARPSTRPSLPGFPGSVARHYGAAITCHPTTQWWHVIAAPTPTRHRTSCNGATAHGDARVLSQKQNVRCQVADEPLAVANDYPYSDQSQGHSEKEGLPSAAKAAAATDVAGAGASPPLHDDKPLFRKRVRARAPATCFVVRGTVARVRPSHCAGAWRVRLFAVCGWSSPSS